VISAARWPSIFAAALLALLVGGSGPCWAGAFEKIPERNVLSRHYQKDHSFGGSVTCTSPGSSVSYPSKAQYRELRDASLRMVKRFVKSERDVVIGLGRSAAAVTAMMRNLGLRALSFPDGGWSGSGAVIPHRKHWPAYFAHFDEILGSEVLRGEHSLIVVDRTCSGSSLAKFKAVLGKHLREIRSKVSIVTVGFDSRIKRPERHADQMVYLPAGNHMLRFNQGSYDNALGRYRSHMVREGRRASEVQRNPGHDALSAVLLDAMKADETLDTWITSKAPVFLRPLQAVAPGKKKAASRRVTKTPAKKPRANKPPAKTTASLKKKAPPAKRAPGRKKAAPAKRAVHRKKAAATRR
jgi:hypothetical protein